jgi:hypothetical protein
VKADRSIPRLDIVCKTCRDAGKRHYKFHIDARKTWRCPHGLDHAIKARVTPKLMNQLKWGNAPGSIMVRISEAPSAGKE